MATALAPASSVTRVIPTFQALSEQGHWWACGIVAELAAMHACSWVSMKSWASDAGRDWLLGAYGQEYVAAKQCGFKNGQPHDCRLDQIYWHLTVRHNWKSHIAGYIPVANTPNLPRLHDFIKAQTYAGNPVIVFVTRAYHLTRNQPGVYGHFVALGGIDSERGYWTANGDTLDGLRSARGAIVPCQWNTWAQLTAAGINGAIALDAGRPATPPPTPAPVPVTSGGSTPPPAPSVGDSSSANLTLLDSALSALQTLRGNLA